MHKLITSVSVEPVTVTEVKQHLRLVEESQEDGLLLNLISAAREYCEDFTRRAFAEQTIELLLDRFPTANAIELPCPPLRSVTSIKYKDIDGMETIFSTDDFLVDKDSEPGRVVLTSGAAWPVFTPYRSIPIRIRFVAGYEQLPLTLRQAMLLLIGHWYENREEIGTATGEMAFSVHALLRLHREEVF